MKRLILILSIFIIGISEAKADKFKIIALNTPQITINGKICRKGDVFDDKSNIKWADNKQSMEVKNLSTGTLYRFSKKVFDTKSVLSVADYFKETKRASTRGEGGMPLFKQSPVKGKYPEKRIALVMGNSDYHYLPYLRNAQKDASDVANLLLNLGFDVVEAYECSYGDMRTALNNFSSKASQYDVALFYFAGHGTQDENINYLIPVDCPLEIHNDLRFCINADDVLKTLDGSGADARLMFIDACRTKKSFTRALNDGFARMEGSIGSVIMFSTQSGQAALDGEEENSPFATALMKNIVRVNIGFPETMQGIVRDTYTLTEQKQYPLQVGTLLSDFRFNSPLSVPAQTTAVMSNAGESLYKQGNKYFNEKNYAEAINLYRKAAEQGYASAQNDLGYMYNNGLGIQRDYAEAVKWYRKAVAQGNRTAQSNLGNMYETGHGVTQNYTEAVNWYKKAAEQGLPAAQCNLGYMYDSGRGVAKNYDEAVKWYRKAAEQGYARGQNNLAYMYLMGYGVAKDLNESVKWYRKAADQGYAVAQNSLGSRYYNGEGVAQDYSEALKWYLKAAEQNEKFAQCNLGVMYEYGQGVPKNMDEALKWYKKSAAQGHEKAKKALDRINNLAQGNNSETAENDFKTGKKFYFEKNYTEAEKWLRKSAEQGNASAQYYLGYMYEVGIGVEKDYTEAAKWYRKSAEQGNASAQCNLGFVYEKGLGVPQSHNEAVKWYSKAADQGNATGQNNLGVMYHSGLGVPQSHSEALKWYSKAADQGNAMAQNNLATMYENGEGVAKNLTEAIKWYRKAAEQGNEKAKNALKRLNVR